MSKNGLLILVLLAISIVGKVAWSQEARATIGGRVTDAQGAVVPDAAVVVVADDTGLKQESRTNSQGNWTVQFLLPGPYRFTIAAPGFKTENRQGITLQTADNKQIDVQLEVGSSSQTVEVTAEAPLIDTTSATSGTVISKEQITEIPSSSHVATLLATLSPGVLAQDQNGNVVHMWSYIGGSQFTADGGRNNIYSNSFQLDGMPNTQHGGYVSFIPPMDSLQEFRVQTNAYDASIGRQAGSTVNMQTRSGGKSYHGSLYEFNQNSFLNANLFQTNLVGGTVPPVHFNEFGGTVGGPVWIPKIYKGKDKTFFFFSYDKTLNLDPRPGSTRSVPTPLERTGDFSQSFTTQLIGGQLQRFPILIYDPGTHDGNGNRAPFNNNKIPASMLNKIAQNLLSYVPTANTPGDNTGSAVNNFVSSATRQDKFPVVSVRVDHAWTNSNHSFGVVRWSHLNEFLDDFFHNAATGNYQQRVAENVGLDHVWTISPTKILDLRFSVSRFEQPNYDKGSGFDPTQLGFSPSFVGQLVKPSFPRIVGVAGDFGTGQAGTYYDNTYYTLSANLTHVHGNHTFRYGAEYWVLQDADGSIGAQPEFDFNNSVWTRQNATTSGGTGVGSSFASFLLGLPNGGNEPSNANAYYSQRYTGLYFQDDWRVTRKLTLNLGLRWDYESPITERYNRMTTNFDPTVLNPISATAQANYAQILASNPSNVGVQTLAQILPASAFKVPGAQVFAGVNGQPRGAISGDGHEWGPRVGVAYQLRHNTVIRGGIGRFTQASFERGGQNGFSRSTPLITTQDSNFTPYDTLSNPFRGGILAPTGASLGPLTNLGQSVNWLNQDAGRAYSWEYSVHIQQQIKSWLLEVGYSHNKTYNIYQDRNMNLPSFSLWKQLRAPQFDSTGRPVDTLLWDTLVPNPFNKIPQITGSIGSSQNIAVNQLLNPIPLLSNSGSPAPVTRNDNPLGKNRYDAMLAKIEHRFSKGFSIINSFTWSKLYEDTSLIGPEISGPTVEHKLGGEDRTFHLSIAPIWELPVGRGKPLGGSMNKWADALVGGWELAGQYNVQSGTPVTFTATDNFFFSGKDISLPSGKQSLEQWFDTTQFLPFPSKNTDISLYPAWTGIQNLPGYNYKPSPTDTIKNGVYQDFATYVRNIPTRWADVRTSRVNELNIGLYKSFHPLERMKVQLRFDAFNAFNHPRFPGPDTNPGNSTFGRVSKSEQNQARAVELGARLTF
jgi:hypothetical protein